ncbi:SGNH hydrolase [Mytilinidion resinicola]|uniref:SGNH hydrolase n=1 Tax=Mytilinidion resinicola TaxID=574789 RepID=A0A6A6YNE9_9PEZI|nr:SGNH hydrolase [Mytilinidion resinicola]KAF2810068.1 SGNH hydrolase [Mytilinidion resinicola]
MSSRFFLRFVLPVGVLLSFYLTLVTSLPHGATPKRFIVAPGTELRILPLGDSITFGWNSTAGTDGYRLGLSEDLQGSKFLFVGTQRSGSMADNYNQGFPGYTISQIGGAAGPGLDMKPNVVLLHAGTNDLDRTPPSNEPYADAPARLGTLIDQILKELPESVVLVAQIINAKDAATEARIKTYNAQVPAVVKQRADDGWKVAVVDFRSVTADELIDGLHPTPVGYKHMGDIWFGGLQAVAEAGWIKPPIGPDPAWAQ